MRSRLRLPLNELALAEWWFGKCVNNSAGLLPALRTARACSGQFGAEVASWRCVASAFGVRDEAAVRTECSTLLRSFHAHTTVDGYRNDRLSGLVAGAHVYLRSGMFADLKECIGLRDLRGGRPCTAWERGMTCSRGTVERVSWLCDLFGPNSWSRTTRTASTYAIFVKLCPS